MPFDCDQTTLCLCCMWTFIYKLTFEDFQVSISPHSNVIPRLASKIPQKGSDASEPCKGCKYVKNALPKNVLYSVGCN